MRHDSDSDSDDILDIFRDFGIQISSVNIDELSPEDMFSIVSVSLSISKNERKHCIPKFPGSSAARHREALKLCQQLERIGAPFEIQYQDILYPSPKTSRNLLDWLSANIVAKQTDSNENLENASNKEKQRIIDAWINETWTIPDLRSGVSLSSEKYPSHAKKTNISIKEPSFSTAKRRNYLAPKPKTNFMKMAELGFVALARYHESDTPHDSRTSSANSKDMKKSPAVISDALVDVVFDECGELSTQILQIRSKVKGLEEDVSSAHTLAHEHRIILQQLEEKEQLQNHSIEIYSKVSELLSPSDYTADAINSRIEEFRTDIDQHVSQWKEKRTPLDRELEMLRSTEEHAYVLLQQKEKAIVDMQQEIDDMTRSLREKQFQQESLNQNLLKLDRSMTRAMHTNRIFDLIHQIRKQDNEIKRIIKDIHSVQVDMNHTSERLRVVETVTDDIIYSYSDLASSSSDSSNTLAYKYLLEMRQLFDDLIEIAMDTGKVQNKAREIGVRADILRSHVNEVQLGRLLDDVKAIREENREMAAQVRHLAN